MGDKKYDLNLIATEDLTIGEEDNSLKQSKGVLQVSRFPFGINDPARRGGTISAALLQIRNTGTEAVTISGFDVRQNGTANIAAITSLTSLDNLGMGPAYATATWKNGMAFVPANATIPAGSFKLFTVKALLGMNAVAGTNVNLTVTGVHSNAKGTMGLFPINGMLINVI
jgi:hypothetical protein